MGRPEPGGAGGYGRILTIPNLISFARLLGIVVFLYLFLGPQLDGWAVAVLIVGGFSDWVDGFLARRLGQVSRLGELIDPLAALRCPHCGGPLTLLSPLAPRGRAP